MIGYKKLANGLVGKILITGDSVALPNGVCRCSAAIPLEITDKRGRKYNSASSMWDKNFVYHIGIECKSEFDKTQAEMKSGIYYFTNRKDAETYRIS